MQQQTPLCLPFPRRDFFCAALALFFFFSAGPAMALTVSNIQAVYRNGQTFITWTSPKGTKLQYNIYRSTSKLKSSSQLNSSNYLGYVRDSSSKNIRRTALEHHKIFFKIQDNGAPLTASQGLYVVTCIDDKSYYYAVTITTLSNGNEDKTILFGSNSLSKKIAEQVSAPIPVWQDSGYWSTHDIVQMYVLFGNNQETTTMPALNSEGSYGYNFSLVKRGKATKYPLFDFYEGIEENAIKGNGLDQFMNGSITNCYILGMDDWLPNPNTNGDGANGDHTYWSGYHQDYNFYSTSNPVPNSGTIKTYSQRRYIYILKWAKSNLPVDTSKAYLVGVSAGGFGVLTTAMIIPDQIAAVYEIVGPFFVAPEPGPKGQQALEMWGNTRPDLNSDILYPSTTDTIPIYSLLDMRDMLHINESDNMPPVFCVYGKNDATVLWNSWTVAGFDSLEATHCGGVFFWDQRDHNGNGANFLDSETTPDFYSFQTTKMFPAFSNCNIDQNIGSGDPHSGATYGAWNGYLGWNTALTDEKCKLSINVFVKNLYVGGNLDPHQYSTCNSDITFRRTQKFHPSNGANITWTNYDVNNVKIQSGSLTYKGGLVTLKGIKINKTGNTITLTVAGCSRDEEETTINPEVSTVSYSRTSNGYEAHINSDEDQVALMNVYDLMGRILMTKKVSIRRGDNSIPIPLSHSGFYLIEWKGTSIAVVNKMIF